MKELFKDSFDKNKIEIVEEQQQKKEIKLIGRQLKKPSLILWEYNEKTGAIERAKFRIENFVLNSLSISPGKLTIQHKVVVNENCVYVQAMNLKNAIKHIKRQGFKHILNER